MGKLWFQVAFVVLALGAIAGSYHFVLGEEPPGESGPEKMEVVEGTDRTPLPDKKKSETSEIVTRDSSFQEIIEGKGYTVVEIVPWRADGRLIGGGVHIKLNEPVWIERTWPEVDYDKSKYAFPHYRETMSAKKGLTVGNLYVRVDFDKRKVVGISPMP